MARLFISYARRDGAALAQRLEADLRLQGHDPWLDRKGIEAGQAWSREIEDAINGCESLLAVLTAGAYESSICRGEQLRALRRGKRIVPLLAQAGADRPVYLEEAHYLDFSDEPAYPTRLADLLRELARSGGVGWDQLSARVRQRLEEDDALHASLPAPGAWPVDWPALRRLAAAQLDRFRDGLAGRGNAPGLYEAAIYVPRAAEEDTLRGFAAGPAQALLLVGDPGVGKTNLLAHWADAQPVRRRRAGVSVRAAGCCPCRWRDGARPRPD